MGASLPIMAESPFALLGCYPSRSRLQAAWAGVTRPSSLLRTHAPDLDAPRAFAFARRLGLRRLMRAPAANRPFPTLSLQSLSRRLDPYPVVMSRCFSSFLPKTQRPHITRDTFGSPDNPCMATSAGGLISGLQSFTHVQAPRLARPPGCSRRFIAEERPGRLHHASLGWFPAPRCGIATCVNEQFTRLDFHQLDCSLVGCSPLCFPSLHLHQVGGGTFTLLVSARARHAPSVEPKARKNRTSAWRPKLRPQAASQMMFQLRPVPSRWIIHCSLLTILCGWKSVWVEISRTCERISGWSNPMGQREPSPIIGISVVRTPVPWS